jgi:hypothetical protein
MNFAKGYAQTYIAPYYNRMLLWMDADDESTITLVSNRGRNMIVHQLILYSIRMEG